MEFLTVVIVACDNGKSLRLCSTCTLNVHILDRNDNKPLLLYPSPFGIVFIDLSQQLKPFQLRSQDLDSDTPNNVIDYSITGGSLSSKLLLNKTSGQLFLRNKTSSILFGTLDICLSDQGQPLSLVTFYTLTFLIHDNSTNATVYLKSLKISSSTFTTVSYSSLFYFSIFCTCLVLIIVLPLLFLLLKDRRRKQMKNKSSVNTHDNYSNPLMKQQQSSFYTNSDTINTLTTNTPASSVTLSTRSSLPPETKTVQMR
ncbi:unnamed protein product, partial [Didymodactylos carnosus]